MPEDCGPNDAQMQVKKRVSFHLQVAAKCSAAITANFGGDTSRLIIIYSPKRTTAAALLAVPSTRDPAIRTVSQITLKPCEIQSAWRKQHRPGGREGQPGRRTTRLRILGVGYFSMIRRANCAGTPGSVCVIRSSFGAGGGGVGRTGAKRVELLPVGGCGIGC